MNFYAGEALTAYFFLLAVGTITWRKAQERELGRLFGLVSLSISFWVLGCFGESYASQKWALTYDVLLYIGACFAPTLFLHFILEFSGKVRQYRTFLICNYLASAFFLFFNVDIPIRHYFISGVPRKFDYRFIAQPNILYYVFVVWYLLPTTFMNYILFNGAREVAVNRKTTQFRYFLLAATMVSIAGTMYFGLVFSIAMPPIDNFFTIAYGVIMSYTILNRQFMDIRLVLRDTTMHFMTAFLLACASLVVGFPLILWNPYTAVFVSTVIMGFLMAFAYEPIRRAIQPAIDRVMFANRFGYLEELSRLPNDMLEFTNLHEMLTFLLTRLKEAARLERVRILMYDPGHQSYEETIFGSDIGKSESNEQTVHLVESSGLIQFLKDDRNLWIADDLARLDGSKAVEALSDLRSLSGAACFPVCKENDVMGVVILGPKRSRESFNQQDMKILRALRIRLENFFAQAMTITQEALNMVKDSHDMKNDVNVLKGRVTWRAMRIAGWKVEFEKHMRSLGGWLSAEETKGAQGAEHEQAKQSMISLKTQALEWFAEAEKSRSVEEQTIQRLAHRLRNWAEYGRVVSEGFRGQRQMEAIDVAGAARMAVERWRPMAERKHLALSVEAMSGLAIWGERTLLEQIIENLIDNGVKATMQGSIQVSCLKDGHEVVIEVQDTGCGIPKEDLGTIFEKPFYQGKGRESLEQSTGVGLYLVAQYAKSLGGRVSAESQEGQGSTFRVVLPLHKEEAKKAEAAA